MDVSFILDGLNDPQREAVTAPNFPLLVLAGAGSGKTRVLVHRIAWLMQVEGVPATSIMAVTFTNKAAAEMRVRIEELLAVPTRGMWFGTFHGICHRLLRTHYQEAGLPENFQVLDSDDQLRMVKRAMRELQVDETKWQPRMIQGFINGQKDEGRRSASLPEGGDLHHKTMVRVYREYDALCQRGGLVDFGELLLRAHELWLHNEALLAHYRLRFGHVLVDEFQDTNTIQYAWLRLLAGREVPITVVGDDDQSIYGWRGARIENIQSFSQDFPGARTVRLEQNYRSTRTILNAANALIAFNGSRLGKNLWTDGEVGEPIDLYTAFNEMDEGNYVADRIRDWHAGGEPYASAAILYRSNAQSRVMEESLLRSGIPYRVYGGLRFYDRLEIRNALAYLRLINHRHDDAAFERVVNLPTRGIGEKSLEEIRALARQESLSLWQASERLLAANAMKGKARTGLQSFLELIQSLSDTELTLPVLTERVIRDSGLLDYHGKEKGEQGRARIENLEELVSATREYETDDDTDVLSAFVTQAALDAGESQADAGSDAVQMMTLHSAKGLEFPLVFLVGMEEGLFPHSMSAEEPGRLEEERRLCYVGITRAMRKLVMSHAESRRIYGQEKHPTVSRFVRDLPSEVLREVRVGSSMGRPVSFQRPRQISGAEPPALQLGQRVMHPSFGEGVVTNCEGSGAHTRVQVNFAEGAKWLVLAYARLDPI